MKWFVVAIVVSCVAVAEPAEAIMIPPGGSCCPTCLCTTAGQLLMVPAFFPLNTQTDVTQPADWTDLPPENWTA